MQQSHSQLHCQNTRGMPVLLSLKATKYQEWFSSVTLPWDDSHPHELSHDCLLKVHYIFIALHLGESPFPHSPCAIYTHICICPFTICPQLALLLQEGRDHLLCHHRKLSRHDAECREVSTALILRNHLVHGVSYNKRPLQWFINRLHFS